MPTIHFLDVTNRDGVQTARTGLSKFGKTMVNFYLARLGVAQSEIGFPFLFHEVPYVRANVALAEAGAFGPLRIPTNFFILERFRVGLTDYVKR